MIKTFKQPIYPFDLVVIIGDEYDSLRNKFIDIETGVTIDFEALEAASTYTLETASRKGRRYTVVIHFVDVDKMSFSSIAHESVHAAKMVFNLIGADVRPNEPFEYLVGYIANCCGETYIKHLEKEQ